MGTPFIALQEPTPLPWEKALPPSEQPNASSIPRTFLDAMTVRSQVFVQEQKIPQANEFDADDPRSAHWVIYASVNHTITPAVADATTGEIIRPRQSSTQSVPIGTLRLVPFPHPPHPVQGGVYVDGELITTTGQDDNTTTTTATTATTDPSSPATTTAPQPTFTPDRPTSYHDGIEPYVKLGRLAVIPEFRGRGIAGQLIRTAIDWMRKHPSYFDPSPAERGFSQLGMEQGGTLPLWNGLFCCHAQADAVKVWEKCGFQVDEAMGTWMEEGILHYGMFLRVEVEREVNQI
ncbi:hypothetical protein N657DRAFT_576606 [Parathielavia appendiculata]|uniref:Glucosamine 6-phosphate N-acetyltransferase n=1 Tax=Parathielavia appendiculata TaxID=2587402 RepID=A0AAN6TW59_9PEZI|nr:hypothetical protein N657DRAFT_576606 [Parathielavia appendiculata]